eukprot:CAMPEP_0198703854 /NCGR_PEP_ID=MMETSP1468-20131203/389581_1 /TAXON_ID=1461545 /ORGANISM="Mantoniella sp, Strain CCMP1436" /LENGTH=80 /DNA_ID=CAMNT_0044462609 /DNA_START=1615 /DNA_END=1853 /DNA_ORIENTATION=+
MSGGDRRWLYDCCSCARRSLRGSGALNADSPPPDVEAPPPASATLSLVAGLEALARTKTCGDAPPTPRHHRLAGTRCAGG